MEKLLEEIRKLPQDTREELIRVLIEENREKTGGKTQGGHSKPRGKPDNALLVELTNALERFVKAFIELRATREKPTLEDIESLPGYTDVLRLTGLKPRYVSPEIDEKTGLPTAVDLGALADLLPWLDTYIVRAGLTFNEQVFGEMVKDFVDYLFGETWDVVVRAPLQNFQMPSGIDYIPLPPHAFLMLADIEELGQVARLWHDVFWTELVPLERPTWLGFTANVQRTEIDHFIFYKARETLSAYLAGIRLYTSGRVGFIRYVVQPRRWNPNPYGSFGVADRGVFKSCPCSLPLTELDEFRRICCSVASIFTTLPLHHKWERRVRVAAQRLSLSVERESDEDAILDLAIAFEALLLGVRDELKYRLSLRTAFLLADEAIKRKEISEFMQEFYNARSAIIHGETWKKSPLGELVERGRMYLREVILKALRVQADDFTERIDNKIWG